MALWEHCGIVTYGVSTISVRRLIAGEIKIIIIIIIIIILLGYENVKKF